MKIIVSGDLHGDWGQLNTLINNKTPDIILQCGDFGWWPRFNNIKPVIYKHQKSWAHMGIKPKNTKVYFCDGNHEEHPTLIQDGNIHELYSNIFHCSRGSILTINDTNILFMGGAHSIDKDKRTPGHDWFPEENINQSNYNLLDFNKHIDIVISHTCPYEFNMESDSQEKINDSNRKLLSIILKEYKPKLWYFGHWHKFKEGIYNHNEIFPKFKKEECNIQNIYLPIHETTKWTGLDYPSHGGKWWVTLEL